jgi:uncharacterized protein YutE (UPF0331/DUF86 family)
LTDISLVSRKLAVMQEHVRRLTERRPTDASVLASDLLLQDAIAMSLLVAVHEALDIALHIASDEGWELAATSREAFTVLARHGVIDSALAASIAAPAHLRNRIAHGYASIDVERLWTELPAGIAALTAYAAAIAVFIQAALPPDL